MNDREPRITDDTLQDIQADHPSVPMEVLRQWRGRGVRTVRAMNLLCELAEEGYSLESVRMAVMALSIADRQERERLIGIRQ